MVSKQFLLQANYFVFVNRLETNYCAFVNRSDQNIKLKNEIYSRKEL